MHSVKKSLGILGTQRLITIAISFVSSIVIARLLTPRQIGIYSVCVSVVGIAHVFREFGVGNYLIQETELTRERIKASLTILLAFAWVIAAALFLFKGAIARFYHEPELAPVISVLALNFLIIPISSPVLSILRRKLQFLKVALVSIAATLTQATTAVVLAYQGFGPLSLAWGSFAGIAITIVLSVILRPAEVPWLPGLRGIRRVASFGSKSSFSTIVNEAGYSAPDLVIGRILTMSAVGLYSRANSFAAIILDQIGMLLHSILFPTFSHESRSGADVVKGFLNRTELFNGLLVPGLCFFGFAAKPLILLLYGPQWLPAAPLASIICFAALIAMPYTIAGSIMMAHGKVGYTAKTSLIVQSINIAAVFAGAVFGLIYIPVFGILVFAARFLVNRYGMKKFFGVGARQVLAVNVKSYLVAAIMLAPMAALRFLLPGGENVRIVIPAYVVAGGLAWLGGLYLTRHLLAHEINIVAQDLWRGITARKR